MVQPHRRPRGLPRTGQYSQFLLGIVAGSVLMFVYLGPSYETPHVLHTLQAVSSQQQEKEQQQHRYPGWNPIHVFYGDTSGILNAENKQQHWFAQVHQDEIIVDLIQAISTTTTTISDYFFFIDLAANDAVEFSNTLALERSHGWKGLCIEPNPQYWYGLSHRNCTVVGALIGAAGKEQVEVKFRGVYGGVVGKLDEKMANFKKEPKAKLVKRYTAPIRNVFSIFKVPRTIDYMSLDVEGAEYLIMQAFPFEDYTIRLLTIERPTDELKTLLQSKGYLFLKELVWWGETLWAHKSTGLSPDHPKIQKIKKVERD